MPIQAAETAEDISRIAFGFMASKSLFAALHVDRLAPARQDRHREHEQPDLQRFQDVPNRICMPASVLSVHGMKPKNSSGATPAPSSSQSWL